jgi:Spy/CpxP family protein refolding chaperone
MIIAILAAVMLEAQPAGATAAPSAAAVSAPATTTSAKASVTGDDEKVVCKSEQVTGTRFATHVCHTKHEWDQIEKDSQDELANQQSQSYRNPTNGH